jgi:hypothetical protein
MNTKFLAGIALLVALSASAKAQSDAPGLGGETTPPSTAVTSSVAPGAAAPVADGRLFSGAWDGNGGDGGNGRVWLSTEYLRWKIKDAPVPFPLLTTGTTGILGDPTTRVLYGGGDQTLGRNNGLRFTAGMWCNPDCTLGVETSTFFLEQGGRNFGASSSGIPGLFRPFETPAGGASLIVAAPGTAAGNFYASSTSRLWGTELNLTRALCHNNNGLCFDVIGGFRYINLKETLDPASSAMFPAGVTAVQPPGFPSLTGGPGSILRRADDIEASNHVYAPQIGARATWNYGIASLSLSGKLGLGWNNQDVDISGRTTVTAPTGATVASGAGFFAPGSTHSSTFVVVPEVNATLGVNIFPWMTVTGGYNFLYINRVARPGDQIEPTRGAPTGVHESDFYAHGLNAGLLLRW